MRLDHRLRGSELVIGAEGSGFLIDDHRVFNIDQVIKPVAEPHALIGFRGLWGITFGSLRSASQPRSHNNVFERANFSNQHERFPDKKKIGFIYVNDDFGKGGFDLFKARASKYDMNIVAAEKYTRGDLDFTSQLSNIELSGAEILVDWSRYAEGALIAKQFKNKGMTIPRFGCDGQALPKFRELAGDAANGMYYATHFSVATAQGIPAAQLFIEKFRAAYNKDPDFVGAEAYDAATATFAAIATAGKADRTAIRDALRTVSFDGVRGKFEFDAKGDPLFATHIVLVKDGQETNGRAN